MKPDRTRELVLCGLKLIEAFTYPKASGDPFRRLMKLSHVIETFAECAASDIERDISEGLRAAIDTLLKDAASWSADIDAAGVLAFYDAPSNLRLLPPKPAKR